MGTDAPAPPAPAPTASYTAHAIGTTTAGGAIVTIGAYVASLYGINPPEYVDAAAMVLVTPLASAAMKWLGVASS